MNDKQKGNFEKMCGQPKHEERDIDYARRCIRERFKFDIKPVNLPNESNIFPIAHPIAKIACGISRISGEKCFNWREYRDKILWTKGSKIANINLYPLGKKGLNKGFPKCYKELFGDFSPEEYKERVRRERFSKIRELLNNSDVKAIICYGKGYGEEYWREFKCLVEIDTLESINSNLAFDDKKKVILTRHFSRGFPNKFVDCIIEILKMWGISLDYMNGLKATNKN